MHPHDRQLIPSGIVERLFDACNAIAAGVDASSDDERRRSAALTLARLMFLSFSRAWNVAGRCAIPVCGSQCNLQY